MAKKKLQKLIENRHRPPAKQISYSRHSPELLAKIEHIAAGETERLGRKVHKADIIDLALQNFVDEFEKESA